MYFAFSACINLTNVTFLGVIPSNGINNEAFGDPHWSYKNENTGFTAGSYIGDLRTKYLAGGIGTYTRVSGSSTWTKQ
jgi:hypothetical protein